jgi:hypothetical protein
MSPASTDAGPWQGAARNINPRKLPPRFPTVKAERGQLDSRSDRTRRSMQRWQLSILAVIEHWRELRAERKARG